MEEISPTSPLPPTPSSGKNWIIPTALIVLLIVAGYFALAKTQNFWPFNSQVAVEPAQTITPTPTRQKNDFSSQEKFYVETQSDTTREVYEISNQTANKISKSPGYVLGVIPQGILIVEVERVSGFSLFNKLSLYNTKTQTSESLVALAAGHAFVGSLSPDGKQVVFDDSCGLGCELKQGEATDVIKSINLSTREIKTIHTAFADGFNSPITIPSGWANNETVVLNRAVEGAGNDYTKVITLNIQSNKTKELVLDQDTRFISVNRNSMGIIFTTFRYDATKKTNSSTLVLKSLDGTAKTLQSSNQLEYKSAAWLDNEKVAVLVKNNESISETSVNEDCYGYDFCTNGKRTIQIINTKTGDIKNLSLSVEPIAITFGGKQYLYYLSSVKTPSTDSKSTNLLHSYNLTTGEDKVVLQRPEIYRIPIN